MSEPAVRFVSGSSQPCPDSRCDAVDEWFRGLNLRAATRSESTDLLIVRLVPLDARRVLDRVRQEYPETRTLGILCGYPDDSADVTGLMESGLDDFCTCPVRYSDVAARVNRLLGGRKTYGPASREQLHFENLIGQSEPFLRAIRSVLPIARADSSVLLTGETGTGKECFARAIHYKGPRNDKPFIAVNCGALPAHLVENELFGHARGAYTDARGSEKGLVAAAEGGTLLLDECDALPLTAQSSLLRFLQEKEYRQLGSTRCVKADVRVIAAANTNLRKRIAEGTFREDLFHRLNVLAIHIPPLRERPEDVLLLARHFVERFSLRLGRQFTSLSAGAYERLSRYAWPGNVRELEGAIHRAVVMTPGLTIHESDLQLDDAFVAPTSSDMRIAKKDAVAGFERAYLAKLLAEHGGNVSHAALAAGKERRAFQRLIRKHGLSRSQFC